MLNYPHTSSGLYYGRFVNGTTRNEGTCRLAIPLLFNVTLYMFYDYSMSLRWNWSLRHEYWIVIFPWHVCFNLKVFESERQIGLIWCLIIVLRMSQDEDARCYITYLVGEIDLWRKHAHIWIGDAHRRPM